MRGPVRVGSHPLDQVVVPSKEGQIQALAPDVGVLVSAKSPEIELLVVDQEVICGPPDLRRNKDKFCLQELLYLHLSESHGKGVLINAVLNTYHSHLGQNNKM